MKRDMDLVRSILREAELCDDSYGINSPAIEGYNEAQIAYHLGLLVDGGFIGVSQISGGFQEEELYVGITLTWKGHDFLDATKDDSLWQKAKDTFLKPGVSFTLDILLVWLKAEAKAKLGL